MDRGRKLVVRAEITKPRLAADRLSLESISYLLIGIFFVDSVPLVVMALARRECAYP
jgi:hypothetical protein